MADDYEIKPFRLALHKPKELANIDRFNLREEGFELDKHIIASIEIFRAANELQLPALLCRQAFFSATYQRPKF